MKDVNKVESLKLKVERFIVIIALILSPLTYNLSPLQAQFNTDRITAIGRNALYFEDYVLSIQYFNQVIHLKPYLSEPYFYRAIAKIQLEDYQGALRDCNAALERNPFSPGCYYARGYIYRQLNQLEQAEADYTEALRFSPETAASTTPGVLIQNIRVERARLRISQQELADAIGVTRQTIYAIENDKFIPSTELALKMSSYFGKTVNDLFSL